MRGGEGFGRDPEALEKDSGQKGSMNKQKDSPLKSPMEKRRGELEQGKAKELDRS